MAREWFKHEDLSAYAENSLFKKSCSGDKKSDFRGGKRNRWYLKS